MKTSHKQNVLIAALVCLCALGISTTQAQDESAFDSSFTLADNDTTAPGAGASTVGPADDQASDDAAELKIGMTATAMNGTWKLTSLQPVK